MGRLIVALLAALAVAGADALLQRRGALSLGAGSVLALAVQPLGGVRGGQAAGGIGVGRGAGGVARLRGGRSGDRERRHRKERAGAEAVVQEDAAARSVALEADDIEEQFQEQLSEIHKEAVELLGKNGGGGSRGVEEEEPVVDELEEEDFDTEERFSYFKKAEREVREAEKAEEERTRMHEEYMERRRRGELPPITEEVRDTLRWGDDREEERRSRGSRSERYEDEGPLLPDDDMPVEEWLEEQGLGMYANLFLDEGWDTMRAVMSMGQDDLVELGVKKGHIRRMMLALGQEPVNLRASIAPSSAPYRDGYREASYARGRPEPPTPPRRRRKNHPDDDIDVKPYAMDNPHEILMEESAMRDNRYNREPVHTSVRTRYGPGGKSNLADAGGLGAFMTGGGGGGGGGNRGREREDSVDDYMPRHRRMQEQKDEIVDRLERGRRQYQPHDRRR